MLDRIPKRFTAALRALGSFLPGARREPGATRVMRPWREDAFHAYPSRGLTPGRALAMLQAADAGAPQMQFELFNDMLQKWPRLAAVEATRRFALTGLDWEVVSGASNGRNGHSDGEAAADFCRETLARIERFRDVLDHLASGVGFGIAVAELIWADGQLIDIVPVPYSRLIGDPSEPWRLRVRTEDQPTGVALDEQPHKWIVHVPRPRAGRHFEGGALRASVLLYVAQNLSFKDWLIFSQIAAMPTRVARFDPGTPEVDQRRLLQMLEALGTDAVAVVNKGVELQFVEAARGGERPYQAIQDYCNTEVTILWLGQHLTTDLRGSGSRAAAEIHDRVREDLLVSDIAEEGRTIRRDLLTPLVQMRFGADAPVPIFRRSLIQSVDTRVLADTLAVAVNQIGLRVPRSWAHRALGIPEPAASDAILDGKVSQ